VTSLGFLAGFFLQPMDCDGRDRRSLEGALEEKASHGLKGEPRENGKKAIKYM